MMDLIGLPLTSIILFVLAGILIGHSFWYRDRSAEREKIDWLERRYLQSRNIARRRKQMQRELDKIRERQQLELGSMRQRYEANLVQFKELQRSSQSTAEQLDALRIDQEHSAEQLASEQRRNEMLVAQLQEVLQTKQSLESTSKQQAETISRLTESVEKTHPQLETEVRSLQGELNQSKEALKLAGEDLTARSADLDVIRGQRDTLKQELAVTSQQAAQVEAAASKQAVKLTNVREQLEELLPLRAQSAEASLTIAQQRLELERLEQERAERAAQQQEVEPPRDQASDGSDEGERRAA